MVFIVIFGKKINNNVTLRYHKEAINTLKSNQQIENNEFILNTHSYINKRLYTGKCNLKKPKSLKKLGYKVSSEKLCDFILDTINFFDEVFNIAPKINKNITVFRMSGRTDIIKLNKGSFFIERNYTATSLNPGLPFNFFDTVGSNVYFEIIIPKNTLGFYYNIPYKYEKNKTVEENEFVLPRDSIYYIIDKKNINVLGYKITKFTLLYVKTDVSKEKITKYSDTLDSNKIKYDKKKLKIPKLYHNNFASKLCFLFFKLINMIYKKKLEYNKMHTTLDIKKDGGFKKTKQDIKLYQGYETFKKIKINDKYQNKNYIFASNIFINAFNIRNIEEIMGNPYNKQKHNKYIIEYNIKKGTLYKCKKIKNKSLSISTHITIDQKVKFKVTKIKEIFDRDLNKINYYGNINLKKLKIKVYLYRHILQ